MAFSGKGHLGTRALYSGAIATTVEYPFPLAPSANQHIHCYAMVVSMDGAGYVEIRENATAIIRFEFVGRNNAHISAGTPFNLAAGATIRAYANGANAYVTVFVEIHGGG